MKSKADEQRLARNKRRRDARAAKTKERMGTEKGEGRLYTKDEVKSLILEWRQPEIDAAKQPHLKGKGIRFRKNEEPEPTVRPVSKRREIRFRRRAHDVFTETIPEALPPGELDVTTEQVEKPQTTIHCPESIKADGIREVRRNPEYYIEINMVTKNRVVDAFYIPADSKKFHYKKNEYKVDEETIYLLPTRMGMFMPTCHYKEGVLTPKGFKQMNKGITGKALSLLYMEQLYTSLLYSEDVKYNIFIVILSIAILIAYGIGCYLLFVYNGGILNASHGTVTPPPIQLIRIMLGW